MLIMLSIACVVALLVHVMSIEWYTYVMSTNRLYNYGTDVFIRRPGHGDDGGALRLAPEATAVHRRERAIIARAARHA